MFIQDCQVLLSMFMLILLSIESIDKKINLTQSSMTSDFQMYGIQQAYPALRIVWHSPWRGNESRAAEDQHCGPVMAATAGESLGDYQQPSGCDHFLSIEHPGCGII